MCFKKKKKADKARSQLITVLQSRGFFVEFLLFIFVAATYISLPFCGGGNLQNLTESSDLAPVGANFS